MFCILTPWFEARFHNNPAQVEIPKDEEEQPQPESEPAEGEKEKEKKESEEESYCRMLQTLNTEAIQVKRGIVTVGKSSDEEKKEQMMGGTTGILVADNGRGADPFRYCISERRRAYCGDISGREYPCRI